MKKLSTIFLLLTSISITHADENEGIIPKLLQYDVEVIIFEDAYARYINSEDWPHEAVSNSPVLEETIKPVEGIDTSPENLDKLSIDDINAIDGKDETPFTSIKPEILNKEYKRINASKEYNVLFYGSWRQSGLSEEKTFEIDLQDLTNTHKVTSENTLTGHFKLVLARYLHIYSQLEYKRKLKTAEVIETVQPVVENGEAPTSLQEAKTPVFENYQINNHRRMRSKKLHYIDHPMVSMLIQINPVKAREESTTDKMAAQ